MLSKLDLGSENPPLCWLVLFRSPFFDGSVLNCLSDDLDVRDTVGLKALPSCDGQVYGLVSLWILGQR